MSESPTPSYKVSRSDGSKTTLALIAAAALVACVLILALVLKSSDDKGTANPASPGAKAGQVWQAVFLANGEVYFGHLTVGDTTLALKDIYYLNVSQKVQPKEGDEQQEQPEVERSLIKLGRGELHCPKDSMTINRDQVLYWEDLKEESQVVQAINAYVATGDAAKKCYDETAGQPGQQSPTASSTPSTTEG